MITIRQIERLWSGKSFARLATELLANRPEATPQLQIELERPVPLAAMMVVRLDELSQAHTPLSGRLVRMLLAAQEADGGWSDPLTTALCLRALTCGGGNGVAIDRGLTYLAQLQKAEGIWPSVPIRRTDADALVSAFILLQLGEQEAFRGTVRLDDAVTWFKRHHATLDDAARRLWEHAAIRCSPRRGRVLASPMWS
ncbi:MAG: hypothetical protein ACREIT_06400 [Tepidisphaeraceae bacterium]